jgi:hypothetical protein
MSKRLYLSESFGATTNISPASRSPCTHGIDEIRRPWTRAVCGNSPVFSGVDQDMLAEIEAQFAPPVQNRDTAGYDAVRLANPAFRS